LAAAPDFWNSPGKARELIAQSNQQRAVLNPFRKVAGMVEESELMLELASEGSESEASFLYDDVGEQLEQMEKAFSDLELKSLLSGELDAGGCYLTLHAGAGGTEACDWAEMMSRMYMRYCEMQGFDVSILEYQSGDEAGLKRVTLGIEGTYAYGYLKAERGVHRLVRISPFDSNSRRHTSFAAVDISADLSDDIEVEVADSEMRVDTFRASGAGGQHVNTTDSAVRITHLPTGIAVACQAERSQHMNRAKALKMLKAKLYALAMDEKQRDMQRFYGPKGEIAWGSQIRSYVLQPYTMVKDLRTSVETSNTSRVLDGDIQMFIEAYLKKRAEQDSAGGDA
jgi:peptide chain release factor 2